MSYEDRSPWQSPGDFVVPSPPPSLPEESPRRSSRKAWVITSIVSVIALLCAGSVIFRNWYVATKSAEEAAKVDQWVVDNQNMASWPAARKVLTGHAAALVAGDEKGWLAAVDPKNEPLMAYYKNLYQTMRTMGVTAWRYDPGSDPLENFGRTEIQASVQVVYCLTRKPCPQGDARSNLHQLLATIEQTITLDLRDGAYRIVEVSQGHRPRPWQNGDLVLAAGKRVVVGAPPALKDKLPGALANAEKAAVAADRYAAMIGTRPERYYLFLAGEKELKTWYSGEQPDWAAGYTTTVGLLANDVVLDTVKVPDNDSLGVIQHEFGHVVTLSGIDRIADAIFPVNLWLQEGIAEYIAFGSSTHGGLSSLGKPPTDMVLPPLSDKSSRTDVSRLYGYGHLGFSCMVDRFGERKAFTFFKLLVRDNKGYDQAAKTAFGQKFSQVNRTCAAYFKTKV